MLRYWFRAHQKNRNGAIRFRREYDSSESAVVRMERLNKVGDNGQLGKRMDFCRPYHFQFAGCITIPNGTIE